MSTVKNGDNTEPAKPGDKQSGSLVLISFCVAVVVLLALMLNHPAKVAEWGSRLFGWRTPKEVCVANLKHIDGAVWQWVTANAKAATDTYSLTDPAILAFLKGRVLPVCPMGGRYISAPTAAAPPICTVPGHTL